MTKPTREVDSLMKSIPYLLAGLHIGREVSSQRHKRWKTMRLQGHVKWQKTVSLRETTPKETTDPKNLVVKCKFCHMLTQ